MFDFDGVIVDSLAACHELSNSISPVTLEEYRARFEGNINDAVRRPAIRQADFFAEYGQKLICLDPHPEMAAAVRELSAGAEYALVIISSTHSLLIDEFLQKHSLRQCFKEILGNDVDKSKVKKIRIALEKYHAQPHDALFITDTLGDVKEAAECSVGCIAVSWGYHADEVLRKGNPYAVVNDKAGLVPAVQAYFKAS
ncbi:MAG: putative phosphatase [Candidatus Taylorbacteria bacterium]|nr:putative phosphatase [Candidatus Taylorbacteria bacterium]